MYWLLVRDFSASWKGRHGAVAPSHHGKPGHREFQALLAFSLSPAEKLSHATHLFSVGGGTYVPQQRTACGGWFSLLPPCGTLRANSDDQEKQQVSFPLGPLISSLLFHPSWVTSHAQDLSSSLVSALKCPHRHSLLGDSKSRQTGSEDQPRWLWFSISQASGHF